MSVSEHAIQSWINWPGRYDMRQRFDRLTFAPQDNFTHELILQRLRQHGHTRRGYFTARAHWPSYHKPHHLDCCASVALRACRLHLRERDVFVDLGCGDSADAAIVAEHGNLSYGVDLFPPSTKHVRPEDLALAKFYHADMASQIPFSSGYIGCAISQAAVDLIEPEARPKFYAEVFRVVAPGGTFVLNGCNLVNGYGYRAATEKRLCIAAGFIYADYFTSAMIFKKP